MKSILNHENYSITEDGKVWSNKSNKFLKPGKNIPGYLFVVLCDNSEKKLSSIHRLVAECFIPNPENKDQVNHKNGIKTDNRVENLEWVTREENVNHAIDVGLIPIGGNHHSSKKVKHLITGKTYSTLKEAAIDNGYKRFTLGKMLNGINSNRSNMIYLLDLTF